MKIQNKQTYVVQSIELNDKDYMNRLLGSLKEMTTNYAIVLNEVSNDILYKKYKAIFDQISLLQREVFEVMFQNGWYQLESIDQKKINQKLNQLDQEIITLTNEDE